MQTFSESESALARENHRLRMRIAELERELGTPSGNGPDEGFDPKLSDPLRGITLPGEVGLWSWTPGTSEVVVSANWRRLFGIEPAIHVTFETWRNALHPDDRDRAVNELNTAIERHLELSTEYRVVWPDGTVHWLADRGRASYDENGRAVGMGRVNFDIADRKQAEEALVQQREWLRVTLSSIGDAVLATDTDGRITFLNSVAAILTGWEVDRALGQPVQNVFRIINEQTREQAEDIVGRVLRDGAVVSLANHTALVARDGRSIPIEDSAAPIRDSAGNVAGAVLVFYDVTEKRRAQEALEQSEQRVRRKLNSVLSPDVSIGHLELGDIIDAPAIQSLMDDLYNLAHIPMAILDLKGAVLVGVGWQDICTKFHRVHRDACKNCIESDTQLTTGVAPGECRLYKCKNNMWDMATPIIVGGEKVGNLFTGQFFLDDEPVDYELFRSQATRYGFGEREYLAALEAVPRLSRDHVDTGMAFLVKLGHMLSMLSYSNIKLARSLAERDALMRSLEDSRERMRRAQEIAHVGSWELDLVNNRLSWSDEVYRIFGLRPQEFGATYDAFLAAVHPEDRDSVDAAYTASLREGKSSYEIAHRVVRRTTGEIRWVQEKCEHARDATGNLIRSIGMVQDITERTRAEEALRQAQRRESIGMLAGGIAHDFNNLLVAVIGNASLAQEMLPPDHAAVDLLDRVVRTGEHAAHLTRQMLAYAGKGRFVIEPVNLSELIDEISGLVRPSIAKQIALDLNLERDLPSIQADRSQMQQIFTNLVLNASEAIGENRGLIAVTTGVKDVDEQWHEEGFEGQEVRPGKYVRLEVRDTGCGMDETTRSKIFDPFFTTKFTGRGLGLAAVAGIVRGHNGAIRVWSTPGEGSSFLILLPAADGPVNRLAAALPRTEEFHGTGTILVIDDEEVVRHLAKQALERYGYEVLVAESGIAGVNTFEREANRIAAIILDLSMPGMSGQETLAALQRLRPDVKVVISSGYDEAETLRLFEGTHIAGFIQKPYRARQLAKKVKMVVADGGAAGSCTCSARSGAAGFSPLSPPAPRRRFL